MRRKTGVTMDPLDNYELARIERHARRGSLMPRHPGADEADIAALARALIETRDALNAVLAALGPRL